jgi:hypothetical protein
MEWSPDGGSEDVIGGRTELRLDLNLAPAGERVHCKGRPGDDPGTSGLCLAPAGLAVDAQLVAYDVDILPAEAGRLALPQSDLKPDV